MVCNNTGCPGNNFPSSRKSYGLFPLLLVLLFTLLLWVGCTRGFSLCSIALLLTGTFGNAGPIVRNFLICDDAFISSTLAVDLPRERNIVRFFS